MNPKPPPRVTPSAHAVAAWARLALWRLGCFFDRVVYLDGDVALTADARGFVSLHADADFVAQAEPNHEVVAAAPRVDACAAGSDSSTPSAIAMTACTLRNFFFQGGCWPTKGVIILKLSNSTTS